MAVQIVIKNSSAEDKRPTAPQLANGEIALNYNAAGSFLTCKDTDGNIQQVGGVKISEVAPESPVKQTLWFQPSSLTLFVYDGDSFLPVAGGGGGGTPSSGITTIIGNNGIDASEIAGVVTLDVELAGGDDGLEFDVGKLKASVASASQLGSVKIGDGIDVTGDGTISVDIPQTLVFRGSVDLGQPPAGQINPNPPLTGDAYVASSGANPIDAGWTGIGGDVAVAGDLAVFDGNDWELINTGGTMQGVDGGAGITASTSGGIATVAVDAGAGLEFDADDKLTVSGYPDLNGGDLDERYLRIDAGTFDQTVESTGTTFFDGRLEAGSKFKNRIGTGLDKANNALKIVAGDLIKDALAQALMCDFESTSHDSEANGIYSRIMSDTGSPNVSVFKAIVKTNQTKVDGNVYGYHSAITSTAGVNPYNFYASGDAPNFLQGDTFIGGTAASSNIKLLKNGLGQFGNGVSVDGGSAAAVTNGIYTPAGFNSLRFASAGNQYIVMDDKGRISLFPKETSLIFDIQGSLATATNTAKNTEMFKIRPSIVGDSNADFFVFDLDLQNTGQLRRVSQFFSQPLTGSGEITEREFLFSAISSFSKAPLLAGYASNVMEEAGKDRYNFYARSDAPNYFRGEVRGGGVDAANSNWVIRPDGSTSPFNIQLQMQSDEPTAFQTTYSTDEDGNGVENTTYIGESESLLAIIKDLRARVEALEAAATS